MRRTASLTALILVILASLGVVVSLVGGWVRTTLFDTDAFMDVIEPSLESEEVVTVLGDAISGQAVAALDLEGRLETRLTAIDTYLAEGLVDALDLSPAARRLLGRADLPRLANLAPSIAEPIEQRIEESIDDFVTSAGFQATLPEAVAFAHRGAVALIKEETDDLENVSIVGGQVRWNVLPAVHNAIAHVFDDGILGAVVDSLDLSFATYVGVREDALATLSEALGAALPEDFGQVTIMSEERLTTWQSIARTLDRGALLAVVVTVALIVVALVISGDRRRTLVQLALGIVVALVITAIVQQNVIEAVDAAIPGPHEQAAADVLFDAVFANLRAVSWVFIAVASVVGITAHIAGRPRWLEALR